MKIVNSTPYKKIIKEKNWENIHCPICDAEWFARGEYWHCPHLVFSACTYFGFDFTYIREDYQTGEVVKAILTIATDFETNLKENNYKTKQSFDDILMGKLEEMTSPDVSHIMLDKYMSLTPDTDSFITIFGYKE